eukprot:5456901-Pleurochrysis_carterae.AAC.1
MSIDVISTCGSTSRTGSSRCARFTPTTTLRTCSRKRCPPQCTTDLCRLREALYARAHRCRSQGRNGPAIIVRWPNGLLVRSLLRWEFPSEGGVDRLLAN